MRFNIINTFRIIFIFFFLIFLNDTKAEENYFLSLKYNKVNVRYGPGLDYPIKFVYLKKNFPVEIIEEHKNKPLGQHSEALERLLYYFRRAGMNDKYVVKCEEPFKKYKIMALSGVRGRSPRLVEDKIYDTVESAYHGLFLRRVQDLMEA